MRGLLLALAVLSLTWNTPASAQWPGKFSGHEAWGRDHIDNLAPNIRSNVLTFQRTCGVPFAATHAFLQPASRGARYVTLHYEALWCGSRRGGICRQDRCLHEVYAHDSGRYRLVFRGYAREVAVDANGNVSVTAGAD